jgi:hypothetical protein
MDSNLPATGTTTELAEAGAPLGNEPAPAPLRQPVSVAFLPLMLAVFVAIAFVIAAWTFLAAAP